MAQSTGLMDQVMAWLGLNSEAAQEEEEPANEVTWLLLPVYDIPGMAVITALLVENQGEEVARDVHVVLSYPGESYISHMEVISDDKYELEGGSPRDVEVRLRLPQLSAGGKVVVYIAGHHDTPPNVMVAVLGDRVPTGQ